MQLSLRIRVGILLRRSEVLLQRRHVETRAQHRERRKVHLRAAPDRRLVHNVHLVALLEKVRRPARAVVGRAEPRRAGAAAAVEEDHRVWLAGAVERRQLLHVELVGGELAGGGVDVAAADEEYVALVAGLGGRALQILRQLIYAFVLKIMRLPPRFLLS